MYSTWTRNLLNFKSEPYFMMRIIVAISFLSISIFSFSQGKVENEDQYFLLTRLIKNQPTSQKVNLGDRIKLKQIEGGKNFGKIQDFNKDQIILESHQKIRTDSIKWIKKTKPTSENVVIGGLLAAVGVALFIPVAGGTVDFDAIVPQGAAGLGLIIIGGIIIDPPKYHLSKGAKITYHYESR